MNPYSSLASIFLKLPELASTKYFHYWVRAAKAFSVPALRLLTAHDYPKDEHQDYIAYFLDDVRSAAAFPLSFFNILSGVGLRSLSSKRFTVIKRYAFASYTSYPAYLLAAKGEVTFGLPLVFSEDVVSAEVLAQMYPLSFAYIRSAVSENLARLISCVTRTVVLCPDRDRAGHFGFLTSRRNLEAVGVSVRKLLPPAGCNDVGDLFKKALRGKSVRTEYTNLKLALQALCCG